MRLVRKLFCFLALFSNVLTLAQGVPPPIPITDNMGIAGTKSMRGQINITMSDADYTLNPNEWWAGTLDFTSPDLTAIRSAILPSIPGQKFSIYNNLGATNASPLIVRTAGGVGVVICPGALVGIVYNTELDDYIPVSGQSGCANNFGSGVVLGADYNTDWAALTALDAVTVTGQASLINYTSNTGHPTAYGFEAGQGAVTAQHPTFIGEASQQIGDPGDNAVTLGYQANVGVGVVNSAEIGVGTCSVANTLCYRGVPIGGTGSTNGLLTISQPTPAATPLLQAANNSANAPVSIVIAGDSFTICDFTICAAGPTVSTNRWPERLRLALFSYNVNHGTGMLPLVWGAGVSPVPVNPEYYTLTGTYDTSVSSLGPTQGSGTENSIVHLDTGAVLTFNDSRNITWDTLHVYGATHSGSGSLSCIIDSNSAVVLNTGNTAATGVVNGGYTASRWDLSPAVADTTHNVTCTASGDFYLYAFQGTAGTGGMEVHEIGIGGATAEMFGSDPTNQLAFLDLLPEGVNAAVMMDQTNDAAGSVSTSTFQTNLQGFITHEQALASPAVVMLAIPPVDVVNGTFPMAPYTAVQLSLCTTNSLQCINIQDRGTTLGSTLVGWGTTYNSASGLWDLSGTAWPAGGQGVHPNDKGSLDEAQLIYAALFNPVGVGGGSPAPTVNLPLYPSCFLTVTEQIPAPCTDVLVSATLPTITLPDPTGTLYASVGGIIQGPAYKVKITNIGTDAVTIVPNSGWHIDGSTTIIPGASASYLAFTTTGGEDNWFYTN